MDTLPQTGTDEEFAAALDAALRPDPLAGKGGWARGRTSHTVAEPVYPRQQLQNLSATHEYIMNWLITNPGKPLKALSAEIGYSQAYLSILIHSDLFQARLREKQDECFSAIKEDLTTKLGALADIGVEKLTEMVESSADPRLIHEVTKTALASMGFGAKTPASGPVTNNVQNNVYVASPADLEAARGRMARQGGPVSSPEVKALSEPGEATPLQAPRNADQAPSPSDPIEVLVREVPRD